MIIKVKNIVNILEEFFPSYLAEKWDNSGLQVGSLNQKVNKILIALDMDNHILNIALEEQVNLIITHHPFFFQEIKTINTDSNQGRIIKELIQKDISLYTMHTNLDTAQQGLNQKLAELLGLQQIKPLDKSYIESVFKLVVFVPETHIDEVREAICNAGAGFIGNYSDCTFQTSGIGTFMPQEGTNPFIGQKNILEKVKEYRLETIVYKNDIAKVLREMNKVHPYEEVAYDLYPLHNEGKIFSPGRQGILNSEITLQEMCMIVKDKLNISCLRVIGDLECKVNKIAVVSGSGASFINKAKKNGADVLITSDIKYHEAKLAEELGLAVIDAGHQQTENIMIDYLKTLLESKLLNHEIIIIPAYSPQVIKFI